MRSGWLFRWSIQAQKENNETLAFAAFIGLAGPGAAHRDHHWRHGHGQCHGLSRLLCDVESERYWSDADFDGDASHGLHGEHEVRPGCNRKQDSSFWRHYQHFLLSEFHSPLCDYLPLAIHGLNESLDGCGWWRGQPAFVYPRPARAYRSACYLRFNG